MDKAAALAAAPQFVDAAEKLKRRRALLFSRESLCLQPLLQALRQESRITVVFWALTCAEAPAVVLETRYPEDPRPRQTLALAAAWAAGEIKMALPRRAILDLHAMAKTLSDPADAARCHAVAQACSAVHTEAHAIGLAVYELTAIARESPPETCTDALDARIAAYEAALPRCRVNVSGRPWADFLCRDSRPNAEARRLMRSNHPRP